MRMGSILVHEQSISIPVVDGNKFLSSYKEGNCLGTASVSLPKKTLIPAVTNCLLTYLI